LVGYEYDPVVLNLQGGNVQTASLIGSNVFFDVTGNGQKVQTGWVTAGEGLLVYDPANTGVVTGDASLVTSFAQLEALDVNHTGVLNASDPGWAALKVWVDQSGTGVFSQGELYSLDQLGITSISLNTSAVNAQNNGNTILQTATFTFASGETSQIAAVGFAVSGGGGTTDAVNGEVLTLSNSTVEIAASATATLTGTGNMIYAGKSDALTVPGNSGDAFVFQPAFGQDVINGFAPAGHMTFSTSDFANWQTLLSHISQVGSDTVITLDVSDTITLKNVTASSLQPSQFNFK
jgi:hypothetical protein